MGLARAADLPVVVVGDIDRGGVFASLFGTLALLDADDQAHVGGFVINKFRGDDTILAPGPRACSNSSPAARRSASSRYVEDLWMDVEDSLALEAARPEAPHGGATRCDVAVLRLRWMSNFTDLDALAAEPGVRVRFTRSAADVERADLLVVPGHQGDGRGPGPPARRRPGSRDRIAARAPGRPILGVCGGFQMLGERIVDDVESGRGAMEGLGLLPVHTTFAPEKLLRRRAGRCDWLGTEASGYEIRHGRVARTAGEPLLRADDGEEDGCRVRRDPRHLVARRARARRLPPRPARARRRRPWPPLRPWNGIVRRRARVAARRPR